MKFKSKVYQINECIDANELFNDIDRFIKEQKERLGMDDDARLDRGHPLQHILNSTSGNYVSPTAMKSFNLCPASYLYNKLVPEKIGAATSVGRTFHTIMERWYSGNDRSKDELYKVMESVIYEDGQHEKANDVKAYVDGYLQANDYLNNKPMDHQNLMTSHEVFIKPIINPLGVELNVPVYTLIDRIDIREDGIYVLDYKTGFGDPNPYLLGENGYLPQMIFYKWAVEAEYGQPINKAYLVLPGADSNECKYVEMNVHSLVEQSKVVEQVHHHIKYAREIRESKIFPCKIMRYCASCNFKEHCSKFIKSRGLDESNIKDVIEIEMDIEDHYE